MPQRGSGGADHSWQNAAKQNQDDDGGQDAHDDSSCRPSWQVTARHVDTSIRRARGKARWPPFSPVRLALILPRPWASTSAKWRMPAGRRPRRKRLRAARPSGRSSRMPNSSSTAWNERQAKRMPMLFSPTIGAAITAGYWFLRARCPACRTTGDVDLRTLDWHRGAAVTALTPALSCRSCRPNAPFAELVCLSKSSVAEEYYAERSGNRWVSE